MKQKLTKRSLALLLAFTLTFSMLIGLSVTTLADGDTVITILHTNDVHGRLYQVDSNNSGMMGIDKIAAIKKDTSNVILVDVGDTIHGLPIVNINEGLNAINLMVSAGYSIMTPGNHDFNYGSWRLEELAGIAKGGGLDIITANVYKKGTTDTLLPSTVIYEFDGVKVGFFGLTTNTAQISASRIEAIDFGEYLKAAEASIAKLKSDGAQVIVALAHIARESIEELIEALTDKPDVILEGHDHLLGDEMIGGVLVAGAGQHQANLGKVTITINASGAVTARTASIITKAEADAIEGDADTKALADEIKAKVQAEYSDVVARSTVLLREFRGTNDGTHGTRNSEQPIGNLVSDAMKTVSGADIAITNGGGLRADIRVGDLSKGDINAVLPFGNVLVLLEATPKQIFDIMEFGLGFLPNMTGIFPQVAGMRVEYDPILPRGERVKSIGIGNTNLSRTDTTTKYTLATNDYLADGSEGYVAFLACTRLVEMASMDDVLIEYVTKHLGGVITAADARIDGRLVNAGPTLWAMPDVIKAVGEGLVPANLRSAYTQQTTRLEFAQLAVQLYETVTGEEIEVGENPFTDTTDVNAIKAFAIGVTEGQGSETTFVPNGRLSRQQAATFLERLAKALEQPFEEADADFVDSADIASWAIKAVGAVQAADVMRGESGGRFNPLGSYTRQQSIVTILRMFNELSEAEAPSLAMAA